MLRVYFTIETELAGEVEGKLIEGTLEELKHVASQWDNKCDRYSYATDANETHWVEVELYEGNEKEFYELHNFVEGM